MPSYSSLSDPKAYHVLAYGTLLGSTIFQTFIGGPVAFKALPRPSFSQLQTAIFPIFFTMQSALPVALALTWPGVKLAETALGGVAVRKGAGLSGLMQRENLWDALIPVAVMFGTSVLNLAVFGPATTKVMKERKHQETRDGKRYYEAGPKSPEMQKLNTRFATLHGISSLSNVLGLVAMIYYGFTLAEQI